MPTSRTPEEILAVVDQAQARLNENHDPGDEFDLRSLVWEVINDVSSSYELAMEFLGSNVVGEISNTVGDYLSNHYGDDGDREDVGDQEEE